MQSELAVTVGAGSEVVANREVISVVVAVSISVVTSVLGGRVYVMFLS